MIQPGSMVSTPAAMITPQSQPSAPWLRVRATTMGLVDELVRVRASSDSVQENRKQKKAATPIPGLISGRKILIKKDLRENYIGACMPCSTIRRTRKKLLPVFLIPG